jgi:hypothetical protein
MQLCMRKIRKEEEEEEEEEKKKNRVDILQSGQN